MRFCSYETARLALLALLCLAICSTSITSVQVVAFVPPQRLEKLHSVQFQSSATAALQAVLLGTSTATTTLLKSSKDDKIDLHVDAVVCGGGPAGLLTAIMLAQKYYASGSSTGSSQGGKNKIHLYESRAQPPSDSDSSIWNDNVARFYTLGVFGRGKTALEAFGVWDLVEAASCKLVGNQVWKPNNSNPIQSFFKDTGRNPIYTLPRDKLVAVLHKYIVDNYADQVELHYGYEVEPVDFDYQNGSKVLLQVNKCCCDDAKIMDGNGSSPTTTATTTKDPLCGLDGNTIKLTTGFLIGADGSARTVANRIQQVEQIEFAAMNPLRRLFAGRPFRVVRFVDDNQRVYKTIPIQLPSDWRHDLGYSSSSEKRRYSIVTLPANRNGALCAVLLMKKDDPMAKADVNPKDFRHMMDESFSHFSQLLSDKEVARVATKPPSNFPLFRYAGPRLHHKKRTVILGDAAHTVKPYNGLGVNCAFEDVHVSTY
jgi:kynurenine 3-monooxygenase